MTYDDFMAEWSDPATDHVGASTSGSTGKPKPVKIAKADMLMSARATIEFFGIGPDDTLATPLAADYIAGKMMAVRALDCGARLLVEKPSRSPLSSLSPDTRIKLVAIVPQQIEGLIASKCEVQHVIVGGAPTSPEAETAATQAWPRTSWWATYGMTETCSHVALRPFGDSRYHALPGVEFSLAEGDRLVISRLGATWSPVVTNDIVDLIDNHTFIFRGRADNAIISGGLKIHPEEVERLIAPALDPYRFYVTARTSAEWGSEVALVVEGAAPADGGRALLDAAALLAGRIRRPRSIIWLDSLPLTDSGKIKRQTF